MDYTMYTFLDGNLLENFNKKIAKNLVICRGIRPIYRPKKNNLNLIDVLDCYKPVTSS